MKMNYNTTSLNAAPCGPLLSDPIDIRPDFFNPANTFFAADRLESFDPATGRGELLFRRMEYQRQMAFSRLMWKPMPAAQNENIPDEYEKDPVRPFHLEFLSENALRLRVSTASAAQRAIPLAAEPSLMLDRDPVSVAGAWTHEAADGGHVYHGPAGRVELCAEPFRLRAFAPGGKLLFETMHSRENALTYTQTLPFGYARRAADYSRSFGAVFTLQPGEMLFGCGESFGNFNKRGTTTVLSVVDANGCETNRMYKPVPFFQSSRGYGMFLHTSSPCAFDFGETFSGRMALMQGDADLDLFIFLGSPREVLRAYSTITGRSPMPPLWSFGLWMSCMSYFSETEGREVARRLRQERIPCDVIHFDTGWFDKDWRCDYEFSPDRFDDPKKMLADLDSQDFHVSLWQLPYFVPKNILYAEIMRRGLCVRDTNGGAAFEDAVLDFTHPETVSWYQEKLRALLEMGVSAIKVDFGESAPHAGQYANGKTGFTEHNLYPLRYNKAVADITLETRKEHIIWARSAWAGSQRYPLHWGGDPMPTDTGLAATLRGGLSLGVCGFSFWSNDIGGFVSRTPEPVLRRWIGLGMFCSHSRRHGLPPTEPWTYSADLLHVFRKSAELRYQLLPYILTQSKIASENGWPVLRPLFFEFQEDPGAWHIDSQFLLGADLLVAPLLEESEVRAVYLPGGSDWINLQTAERLSPGWHTLEAAPLPVLLFFRAGKPLPVVPVAQATRHIDWTALHVLQPGGGEPPEAFRVYHPQNSAWQTLPLDSTDTFHRGDWQESVLQVLAASPGTLLYAPAL